MEQNKYLITVQNSEGNVIFFHCREDESILYAMLRNGKGPLQYGCCGGGCGICKMRIEEGTYHIFKKMSRAHIKETEIEQNIVLLCCIQPRSAIRISPVFLDIAPANMNTK